MSILKPDDVLMFLPDEPEGYYYSVEQVSPLVMSVWLNHKREYIHTTEPVRTIYCFIKSNRVHPPSSCKKMRPKSVCSVTELWKQPPHTTITHNVKSLQHLG